MPKRISVVIPVCNDADNLASCLSALQGNDYNDYEIIVVDDCSQDNSAKLAVDYGCKVVSTKQRIGPAGARQLGVKHSEAEIVAFLDSDCQPPVEWLKQIDSCLTEHIAGLGGIYDYEDKGNYFSLFLKHFSQYWFSRWPRRETDFLLGGNCAYWLNVLREPRPCREQVYFKGINSGDDTLMNLEISRKHKLLFLPELSVIHSYFGLAEFLNKQVKWGFSRSIISLLYSKEKLFRAKDLPVIRLLSQLLFTVVFLASLVSLNFYIILPAAILVLSAHLNDLCYLYRKTSKLLFIPYAFFVLILRNISYLLGAVKGMGFLIARQAGRLYHNIRILFNFLNPRAVSKLHFFITSRCNAECGYCFLQPRSDKGDLSLEEIEKIAAKCGIIPYVVITGGEPFLRDDLADICRVFYDRCLSRFFVLATNGFFTEKILEQVKEIFKNCPDANITVQLPVDGIGAAHDRQKKLDGSFQRLVATANGLYHLKKYFPKLSLNISTVVTKENCVSLEEISAYFRKDDLVDNCFLTLQRCPAKTIDIKDISQDDYFSHLRQFALPAQTASTSFFSRLYSHLYGSVMEEMRILLKTKTYLRPCLTVQKLLVLNEQAQVRLCEVRRETVGSLSESKSLKALFNSEKAKALRKKVREEKCFCNWGCALTANFIFSPAVYPGLIAGFLYKTLIGKKR